MHPGLAAVEAEQREKPDCLVQVLDDKADVDEVGDARDLVHFPYSYLKFLEETP